jgi:thiol:disulfide interchange protein
MQSSDFTFKATMAILIVLCVAAVYRIFNPSTTFAADGVDPNWDAAARRYHANGHPTLVIFTANWCPACQALHGNVLSRDDVQNEIENHFNYYAVDLSSPSERVQAHSSRLGVRYIPQLIRYDANGQETARANYMEGDELLAWLKAGE